MVVYVGKERGEEGFEKVKNLPTLNRRLNPNKLTPVGAISGMLGKC